MPVKIALGGNPNSGKTTMFNSLTGSSQYVGNWPGVTVEKKEGRLIDNKDVIIQDLPGIYSLSPYTPEEIVTRNYLINDKPGAIINIVDASNIERNLYLTTQLAETGIPIVIALNMMDVVRKRGDITIDVKKLGERLGYPIIETSALIGYGSREAALAAVELAGRKAPCLPQRIFPRGLEDALDTIGGYIPTEIKTNKRWYAVKLFERDKEIADELALPDEASAEIEKIILNCEGKFNDDSESIIASLRYEYIETIMSECVERRSLGKTNLSGRIDGIVTNRVLALPVFALVMFLVYFVSISTVGAWMSAWVNESLFGNIVPNTVGGWLEALGTTEWLCSLILDGIIAGVGSVLGFLPQMLTLFLCLALLEECGYMSRIAFILDRIFRRFGLSGKSFIPMLVSSGCGVPGIMASRTIERESDRRMTVMTATFIPCGAKLPVIALIASAAFGGSAWVAASAYLLGIAAIIVSGVMLKKTRLFAGDASPFVMELPGYHLPGITSVLRASYERGASFVKKAGTIVLLGSIAIWALSRLNWALEIVDTGESILASVVAVIAPLFSPLGWGDWRAVTAVFTGLIAKENIVGTLGVLFGFAGGTDNWTHFTAAFTPVAAYSFLAFNLLCAPCLAAIGALRREMASAKWTWFAIGYQCVFAYLVSLMIYQFGRFFAYGGFGGSTIAAASVLALIVFMLFKKPYRPKRGANRA